MVQIHYRLSSNRLQSQNRFKIALQSQNWRVFSMNRPLLTRKRRPLPYHKNREVIASADLPRYATNWILDGRIRGFADTTLSTRKVLTDMLFSFLQAREYEKCGAEEMGAFFLYVRTDRMAAPATLLTYYSNTGRSSLLLSDG
jgi:hypothetical protein